MPSASRPAWRRSFARRLSAGTTSLSLAAAIGSAREGGHRPPRAAIPLGRLRHLPQAAARPGRSAGGLVPHLVAVGKGRQSARAARSADGLAGRRHQGFGQGFDWPAAARSEVWRRCRARSGAARQAVDPTAGCQRRRRESKAGRAAGSRPRKSCPVRSCRPAGRCRCGFPIRAERSVRRSSRPRRSWPRRREDVEWLPSGSRRRRPSCRRCTSSADAVDDPRN